LSRYAIGVDFGSESGRAIIVDVADGTDPSCQRPWTVAGGMVGGTIATAAASPQPSADDAAA